MINGVPIVPKTWYGQKILFCSDISKIHRISSSAPRYLMCKYIRVHQEELVEYEDFFLIPGEQCRYYWNTRVSDHASVFAFTKSGYDKLVSVMNPAAASASFAVAQSGYFTETDHDTK